VSILEPDYWVPYSDGSSLTLWEEAGRTAEEIARFSKRDADAYLEFDRYFDRLGRRLRQLLFVVPPGLRLGDAPPWLALAARLRGWSGAVEAGFLVRT
jgi:phytoene dehydrogenase-like protein